MDWYDGLANGYDELYKDEQINKLNIVKQFINPKTNENLLDIGCGTNFALNAFNCTKMGIDKSKELLERSQYKTIPSIQGVAEYLPFQNKSYDYAICLSAIHNFDDIEKSIKEMIRVIKKKIAISVLKRSAKFQQIDKLLKEYFIINTQIDEGKDNIYILSIK